MARKKYGTSLEREIIRKIQQLGLDYDKDDNQVIEEAVEMYDKKIRKQEERKKAKAQ